MAKERQDLPPELIEYLRRRATRTGRTLEQTLEMIVRESMAYDELLAKMSQGNLSRARGERH